MYKGKDFCGAKNKKIHALDCSCFIFLVIFIFNLLCSSVRPHDIFSQIQHLQVAMQPRVGGVDSGPATAVVPARPPGKEGPHLPWTGSMAGPEFPLTYMPFMEHLLNTLARSFGEMTALPLADKLAFVENSEKQARMIRSVSLCCVRLS